MTWTAQAEDLAATVGELAAEAAGLNGAIWAAGVDPEATASLIGAAIVLGASQRDLFPRGTVVGSDAEMVEHVTDLEHDTGELLRRATDLTTRVEEALERAILAAAEAEAAGRRARSSGQRAAAAAAHKAAMDQIADCQAALEILSEAIARLDVAYARLQQVPSDLGTVYEAPYAHIARGGVLPHSGDFLTGVPA